MNKKMHLLMRLGGECETSFYFIYRQLIYLSRVATPPYLPRAKGLLWPPSLLWV